MATEPKIFTKNYVNSDDTFVVSSGSTSIANAYDRDKVSQWSSSGANSDATSVTIQVTFYEGSTATTRSIDTFLLVNHNLKNYTVGYWTGTAWTTFITVTADATPTASFFNTASSAWTGGTVTTTQLLITANTTQTANQEKVIGEIVAAALQVDFGLDMTQYNVTFRQAVKDLTLGDGSIQRTVIRWSPNRYEKYEATALFQLLSTTNFNAFYTVKESGIPFLWYPESVSRPDEIWLCYLADPFAYSYTAPFKTAGFTVSFKVREV